MLKALALALSLASVTIWGSPRQATGPEDTSQATAPAEAKAAHPPKLLSQVDAEYSDEAQKKHINGRCMISLTVDTNGMPQDVKVARCSDPTFEKASVEAVAKYRFAPATALDGSPVPVKISVQVNFNMTDGREPGGMVHYSFSAPPGASAATPDSNGVYPLTSAITMPILAKFSDHGYVAAVNGGTSNSPCDIVLTISAKGKASDALVTHCERSSVEQLAVESLLKSQYKPGSLDGKAVAVRVSVHLEYGFASSAN